MKRQIESKLLAVVLTALLTGLALPGLAQAGVKVNVNAIEYDNNLIVVSILAVSSTRVGAATLDLWDLVGLTVSDGTVTNLLDPALHPQIEEHSFPLLRSKLWVVKISGNLILDTDGIDADTVTAVVDLDGTTGTNTASDTATCGPGPSRLPRITAICK